MRLKEIMVEDTKTCRPNQSLLDAARLMRQVNCGAVPIVDENKKVLGILTDRDICLCSADRDRKLSDIRISEAMTPKAYSCHPNDTLDNALETMREHQVRRVPIVDDKGVLKGIVTMDDIICKSAKKLDATEARRSYEEVVGTLQDIHEHQGATVF